FAGGMRRRLNIACGLMHQPQIVLLDEPTVGVDPQSRERIYEMLSQLQGAGVSIVLTTHHLEEAEQRCERIVIIDHGKIVAGGSVAELVSTIVGRARPVSVLLRSDWPSDAAVPSAATLEPDRRTLRWQVSDVGVEPPALLSALNSRGTEIVDVHLGGATLQDVFIALTGRELRE